MRTPLICLFVVASVLAVVPGWTGAARMARPGAEATIEATPVAVDPVRIGGLDFLGGVSLSSSDPAFEGFSGLAVQGDAFTMVSDGGVVARFRMGRDWRVRGSSMRLLSGGPGRGWEKRDRDAEALVLGADGTMWVGFEGRGGSAIVRYAPAGAVTALARPAAMRGWPVNGGIETLARGPSGEFVVIAERPVRGTPRDERTMLVFAGDPTRPGLRPVRLRYRPPTGTNPADATFLSDGRLLVLNRRFATPFRFTSELSVVEPGARGGPVVTGRRLAVIDAPGLADNHEAVAAVRDGGDTIIWLLSDDNGSVLQRTLLLKFRLRAPPVPAR